MSIIFEPTLTTRPPMRLSSTVALMVYILAHVRPASWQACRLCVLVRALAEVTTLRSLRRLSSAILARSAAPAAAARTGGAFRAISASVLTSARAWPILVGHAVMAAPCSSRCKASASGSPRANSSLSAMAAARSVTSCFEFRRGLCSFKASLKDRSGIARSNACGDRSWFGHVHPFDVLARIAAQVCVARGVGPP